MGYGFVKVAAAVPRLKVADCAYNAKEIREMITRADQAGVQVLAFPELCITGYTCADLFHQQLLLTSAEQELGHLLQQTTTLNTRDMIVILGLPIQVGNQKFNCAVLIQNGKILGVVPKTHLPNYSEFYEKRWFSSAEDSLQESISLCGQTVPFGNHILFKNELHPSLIIGVEICEDVWTVIPPSSYHALEGATLILNPSASNDLVGKHEYRKSLIAQQSARCFAGYVYVSSGFGESTTDVVFGGSALIYENGVLLEESTRFSLDPQLIVTEIDMEYLVNSRSRNAGFTENLHHVDLPRPYLTIPFQLEDSIDVLTRTVNPFPFVPSNPITMQERCQEILNIQASGLMKRLIHIGSKKVVLGISGGLDSTLALLVCVRAFDALGYARSGILGITMPGFGTTDRTYKNALALMKELAITSREISIRDAVLQHFQDIGQDPDLHDVTYENSQARERTQILMDVANKENAIVIGTGDLSELALGWATYNGDHMSMYGVNASIPKTLVRHLVKWVAEELKANQTIASEILLDILDTPVSPELTPPNSKGEIVQKTEGIVGNYDLNDFFLYQVMKCGFSPEKIVFLAEQAFSNRYSNYHIIEQLGKFYKRFFTQQFKRSCLPDGVKVGSISLSPRGDWRMPSDAMYSIWLQEVEEMKKQ